MPKIPESAEAKAHRFQQARKEIESSPAFKRREREIAQQAAANRAAAKERYESNSEVQRHRTLTHEEKMRGAIELSAKNIKAIRDMQTGRDTSYEEAVKKAEGFARRCDVDRESKK